MTKVPKDVLFWWLERRYRFLPQTFEVWGQITVHMRTNSCCHWRGSYMALLSEWNCSSLSILFLCDNRQFLTFRQDNARRMLMMSFCNNNKTTLDRSVIYLGLSSVEHTSDRMGHRLCHGPNPPDELRTMFRTEHTTDSFVLNLITFDAFDLLYLSCIKANDSWTYKIITPKTIFLCPFVVSDYGVYVSLPEGNIVN